MAGLQNSNNKNKHFTDSSNTNPALTTASTTHYLKPPTTPTSPALSTSNTTTKSPDNISSSESPRNNNKNSTVSNTTTTTTTNTSNSNNNNSSSSSNSNSPAGPRSLVPTTTHSAFSPYSQQPTSVPQHPTPVTTPTNTTITTKNSQPNSSSSSPSLSNTTTMMSAASHLDNTTGGTALIYPQHTHFTNPTTHSFWPWGFSGGNPAATAGGATVLSTTGGSAFVPAVGYGAGSNMAPGHNPRPKLTTTIWEDEGTLCYQVDARGICVARRQDNDMINGTKLLNVVGMSRGKRDGILKNEKGRVVVKVGAMHLKGVWITFARAKTLAAQFKISELLYPLFVDDPSIFLHNSYGQSMSTRIPSLNNAPTSQWRPTHHYPNNFNNAPYTPETTRQWYPYGNGNPLIGSPNGPHGQEHGSPYPPAAGGYSERPQNANPPAVPMYQPPRNHNAHPQAHLEEYDTGYNLINGQSQGQQGVAVVQGPGVSSYNLSTDYKNAPTATGYYSIPQNSTGGYLGQQQQQRPPSSYEPSSNIQRNTNPSSSSSTSTSTSNNSSTSSYSPVKTEENNSSNGNGYMRPNGQGLYNLVSAADAQNNSQLIGQKRGYVGDDENDDYNNVNNSSQPSPPLAMHPPPPLSGIAVSGAMNVAAGSFPSPMNVSPNSPPGNSAFSGWNPNGKRVKYEFPESTTPPSAPSPRFQLPGLGAGPATPGANPSTPQAYTSSNLQMVTNAQSSPHYSNATSANTTTTNGGPATGTTTPTTEGLDRFFDQGTVLQTPSPENVSNTTEESNRRYEYRTRDTSEEINHGAWD